MDLGWLAVMPILLGLHQRAKGVSGLTTRLSNVVCQWTL